MAEATAFLLAPDGEIPNHPHFPLLVYENAFPADSGSEQVRELFESNRWENTWVNGVYSYHHFHSTAHEVLGCYRGRATVQFGGPNGPEISIAAGSAVVIPAGVGHRKIESCPDFGVVGAYPEGTSHDLCTGRGESVETMMGRIEAVSLPDSDPVHGEGGPLFGHWK